jgi:lysophospholipase L1-like esterase
VSFFVYTYTALHQSMGENWMPRFFIRQVLPRILMVFSSLVIVFIGLEIAMQVYYRGWGNEEQKVMYIYSSDTIRDLNIRFIAMPFVGYVPSPRIEDHNALGFRDDDIEIPKPVGVFRIIATGGSTTYGDQLSTSESWPQQLERILHEDYGLTNVEVINAGVVGYTSWNTFTNFAFRAIELEPDMVLVYDSVNDLVIRLRPPECYNAYDPTRGLTYGQWRNEFDFNGFAWSAFYRYLGIRLGWIEHPLVLRNWLIPLDDYYPCSAEAVSDEVALANNPPIYFERNLRSLVGVGQVHGIEVVLSSWAYYPESTSISPEWIAALEEQNLLIEQVATETNTLYYDLMGNLSVNQDYWLSDDIHQSPLGAEEQARLYAAFLIENELVPPLPEN